MNVGFSAVHTIETYRRALDTLSRCVVDYLERYLDQAVSVLRETRGRVIVTGVGKSGHIGHKLASTMASTGTKAFFVHPSEASHGDLGMIAGDDAIVALSWSGETAELFPLLDHALRFRIPIVAITSAPGSRLARVSTIPLILPVEPEACPNGMAPTTSAMLQLAIGDVLAIALLQARGFTSDDFKTLHPGGALGRR